MRPKCDNDDDVDERDGAMYRHVIRTGDDEAKKAGGQHQCVLVADIIKYIIARAIGQK